MRQWISYDTYGQIKVLLPSDHDGDGTVTQSDLTEFYNAWKASEPAGDFNCDGSVTSNDYDAFYVHWQAESQASPPMDEARIGFAGYVRDPITGWLLARNRWYDPAAGRWVTRDPAGYVDGMSLYLYVKGNPLSLVDPMGLIAGGAECSGVPHWNHTLPKQVFLDDHGRPLYEGIDPNDKEFGRVMTQDDHKGGAQTGNPSNQQVHNEYNKHWREWIEKQKKEGKTITRQMVVEHLREIEGAQEGELKKFADWLAKGVKAEHSYSDWGSVDKEKWLANKVEEARQVLQKAAKEAAAGDRAGAARAMRAAGKALKVIGWIGVGGSLLYNASEVHAGNKCWQEGMIDSFSPVEVQDTRNMQTAVNEGINNWQGNVRSRIGHIDSTRTQPGCKPFPIEQR